MAIESRDREAMHRQLGHLLANKRAVEGIGAANTIVFRDGRRIGYNTDARAAVGGGAQVIDVSANAGTSISDASGGSNNIAVPGNGNGGNGGVDTASAGNGGVATSAANGGSVSIQVRVFACCWRTASDVTSWLPNAAASAASAASTAWGSRRARAAAMGSATSAMAVLGTTGNAGPYQRCWAGRKGGKTI